MLASRRQPGAGWCGLGALICAVGFLAVARAWAQPTIPTTFVLPSGAADPSRPGFVWRVHQLATGQPNNNARTEAELAGLLGDNLADPNAQGIALAPSSSPDPATAPIAFEIGGVINLSADPSDIYNGNFVPDDQMPGLPGTTGSHENAAAEILTWLDLPAGPVTLGVNSDDGFLMTLGGASPSDRFAIGVGEFDGGRPAGDTLFSFTITQPGLYAARCTWEQGCCGANIELFSVNPDGTRVLVNDIANGGIRAYRAVTIAPRAYARKVTPAPGAAGVRPNVPIVVELVDGGSAIDPATVKLSLDGTSVTSTRSKTGDVTTIAYTPAVLQAPGSQHTVALTYTEGGSPVTVNWGFTVAHYVGPNGNLYEVVLVETGAGLTWEAAKAAAEQQTFCGARGHLATITSADADVYLEHLRQESGFRGELWVGGSQLPDQAAPTDGWFWANSEGPISGVNGGPAYSNWRSSEPNDYGVTTGFEDNEENYVTIGLNDEFGWNDSGAVGVGTQSGYVVEYERVIVPIDLKPGIWPNVVNLDNNGKLPVAILSTATFDAATVNPATIRFGPTGTEAAPVNSALQDVNGDGRKDLVCQFNTQDAGLVCGDTSVTLLANTRSGCPIKGLDSIQPVGCPAYALAVQPLQDVHHLTDIYLTVTPILAGYSAPLVAQHIQLKSFDSLGALRWTRNVDNVVLHPETGGSSSADLPYTDLAHYQKVKAQVQVPNSKSGSTVVLRQTGVVLLRPDLTVEGVNAPSPVYAQQILNVSATVRELNGDLGATATVYLMEGANVLDVVNGLSLHPRGEAGVMFSHIFTEAGTHHLQILVSQVAPGDYDPSNNAASFSVEVAEQPASYYAYYTANHYEYLTEEDNPYWTSRYQEQGDNEYLSEQLYIPAPLNFPLDKVTLDLVADGTPKAHYELLGVTADSSFGDACFSYQTAYRALDDGVDLYLQSYRDTCYNYVQSYASLTKNSYDYVFHSVYYDKYWGTTTDTSGALRLGDPLGALYSLGTSFVVEDDGHAYGGTAAITLSSYSYDYAWNYVPPDYWYPEGYYRGFSRGTQIYGSNSGNITP